MAGQVKEMRVTDLLAGKRTVPIVRMAARCVSPRAGVYSLSCQQASQHKDHQVIARLDRHEPLKERWQLLWVERKNARNCVKEYYR